MTTAPRARDRAESMAPGKRWTGRLLHQSSLCLGDQTPCYSTTHGKSFPGRSYDGKPLIFHLSDPPYPSQHLHGLDIRNVSEGPSFSFSSTHSRDVHSPKEVTPHDVLRSLRNRNWTRNRDGLAMKEVTNPPEGTLYRSSYSSDHCGAELSRRFGHASGRPTLWHRHDILTGEERPPAGPGQPRILSVEREVSGTRPWERECTSLRLY